MVQETKFIWLDGKFIQWQKATVHVLTHAIHYGTAIFEGIKCYETSKGPAIFRLKEHNDRLFDSAHIYGIEIPFAKKEFFNAIKETVKRNGLVNCYIRPFVFLGEGPMGLNPINSPVRCCIAAWNWGAYLGEEGMEKGIRLKTSTYTRNHVNAMMTKAKISGNYANSVLAKREAVTQGYDEALMLDTEGYVAECSGENIFIIRGNKIKTTPATSILPGITRDTIIQIAQHLGYPVAEQRFTRDELSIADECFLSGTAAELTPVREVDDRKIGEGRRGVITKRLQETFLDILHGRQNEFKDWLEMVR